jgi:O-antigen/teichoic acid export membrane protein
MNMPSGLRSILRNFSYLCGSQMLAILIGSAYAIFLARLLEPPLYGLLTYGVSWYLTFIPLTVLGLDMVLARGVGRDRSTGPALAGGTLALRAIAALTVAILSASVGVLVEPDPLARQLLVILSIALLGRSIWFWCGSVFVAFEDTRRQLLIDLTFRPLEFALTFVILFWVAPKSVLAIVIVQTALWWIQAAVGVATVVRKITPIEFRGIVNRARNLTTDALPAAVYGLTVTWFLQSPIVLFRQVTGVGDTLGHFALAIQMMGYLLTFPYIVGTVALPVLSRYAATGGTSTKDTVIRLSLVTFAFGVVSGLFAMWLAPAVTALIFGQEYRESGRILGEAIWLLIPFSLAIGFQQILFSLRVKLRLASLFAVLGVLAMAVLFLPLTKAWTYHGALLATGIGMALWALGLLVTLAASGGLSRSFRGAFAGAHSS